MSNETRQLRNELAALRALLGGLDTVSMHACIDMAESISTLDRPLRRELLRRVRADVKRIEDARGTEDHTHGSLE